MKNLTSRIPAVLGVLLTVLLCLAVLPAQAKKKGPHKITLSAQSGAGLDSNVFNKKNGTRSAAISESSARVKYDFKVSKKLKWGTLVGTSASYRAGGAGVQALKIGPKAKTGLKWLAFGDKSKKHFRPNGTFAFNVGYSGVFNPTLNNPTENVDVIDAEDDVDDSLEDGIGEDFEDEGFEEEDDFGDDEEFGEEDGEDEEDDEADGEDPVGSKFFNSKPPRHTFGGDATFTFSPTKKAALGLATKAVYGDIGETAGSLSSDYWQWGSGLKFSHKFFKKDKLTLSTGYGLSLRNFKEKLAPSGDKMRIVNHSFGVGAKIKPIKRLRLTTNYRYGLRDVPPNTDANSYAHQVRFGVDVKIIKGLYAFAENNVLLSGRTLDTTRDAFRYQGLAGVKGSLKFTP